MRKAQNREQKRVATVKNILYKTVLFLYFGPIEKMGKLVNA